MGRDVELKAGRWRAVVSPDRGGRLRWLGETSPQGREPWLRPLLIERGTALGGAGVMLLGPSSPLAGLEQQVPDPACLNAGWQVTQWVPDRVTLMLHPGGGAPGSWGFQASQTLRLEEQRLEWSLSVRNLSRLALPARFGWQLHFPEDFAGAVWLDEGFDALRLPGRGHVEHRDPWCGLASLSGAGGRMVLARASAPLDTLGYERHATRSWVQLRLMTADSPRLVPLPRGEELQLQLSLDLMTPRLPPLPRLAGGTAGSADGVGGPGGPLIL